MAVTLKNGKKPTCILFEPSEEEASTVRSVLHSINIDLIEWNKTGVGWLAKYAGMKPTFVMVNYVMPRVDGFTILKKLLEYDNKALTVVSHPFRGQMANDIEAKALIGGALAVIQQPMAIKRSQVVFERVVDLANSLSK